MIKDMRHRIIIESPVFEPDGTGGQTVTWVEFQVVWAKVTTKARERVIADRVVMAVTTEITIRDLPGLDSTMRVLFRGNYLQIKSVVRFDNERRFYMTMLAEDQSGS